jgi:AcrR family transcriptional regulator
LPTEQALVGRGLGRPRDPRADRAILDAALELMAEAGIARLRVDDVAARAGVGKATIYRRFATKDDLITAAVAGLVSDVAVPETGSTYGDLDALMRDAVQLYTGPLAPRLLPDLVSEMARNAPLAAAVRRGFLARRRDALRTVLVRGVERGDLRSDLDYELALDTLLAPVFYRLLVTGERIDYRLVDSVVALVMRTFAPQKPGRSNPTDRKESP